MRQRVSPTWRWCGFFILLFLTSPLCFGAETDIKIKVLAVNPSAEQELTTTVTHQLPAEINSEQDIVDRAGMELKFDAQKKCYTLSKEVVLRPMQTVTFEVRVKDVWKFEQDEMDELRKNLERQILGLSGTQYFETAKLLYDKALENLDRIVTEQNQPIGVKQHVELHRAHVLQFNEIKENALSLDAMRRIEEEKKKGIREARFVIEAENPSREPRTITIRSPLPKDIKPDDVLDKQGFSVIYDQVQKTYMLEKQEEFGPREIKKYTIVVRDIWAIPDETLNSFQKQTERLLRLLEPTPFDKYASEQGKLVYALLDEIRKLQAEVASSLSLDERMRAFVKNSQKLEVVKAKIRDLQQLFLEIPDKRDDPLQAIKNLVKKLTEVKKLVLVAMGIRPDRPVTWWIIFGIILFLAAISVVFYMTWLRKLQENIWEKKKPAGEVPPPASPSEGGAQASPPGNAENKEGKK